MALLGDGAICIWNDVTPEGRADFYAWHVNEHIPERVGIPGFLRGRRLVACEVPPAAPEFFTLYETVSPDVTTSAAYLARLNDPTPWSRRAQSGFRNTLRSLTRIAARAGAGPGGIMATLRLGSVVAPVDLPDLAPLVSRIAMMPAITGVALCLTDADRSAVKTAESRDRGDVAVSPQATVLFEGCGPSEVGEAVAAATATLPGSVSAIAGLYRLEHIRAA